MMIDRGGSTPLLLTPDDVLQPRLRCRRPAAGEIAGNGLQLAEDPGCVGIPPPLGSAALQPGLGGNDTCQCMGLPDRPMLASISQQRMPCDEPQMSWNRASMQGMVMDNGQRRFIPHRPARRLGTPTEIDIFVIEEEIAIEPAHLLPADPASQQAATGDPIHPTASI